MDGLVKLAWIAVLAALFASSLEPVLAKVGYRGNVDPWQLLFLKNTVGAIVITPLTRKFVRVSRSELLKLLEVALLLLITSTSILWAVKRLAAVTVITLVTTTPAFVALLNQWQGRDKLNRQFWMGFGLCFAGVLLSVKAFGQEISGDGWGLALVALSIVSSTIYRTRLEVLTKKVPPLVVSTYIFWIHGLVAWLFLWPTLNPLPTAAYPIGVWLGLAAAVANVAFLYAIHLVGSTNMSIFNLLQRPLVVVVAALALSEPMSASQWLGVILVVAGVKLAQVKRA